MKSVRLRVCAFILSSIFNIQLLHAAELTTVDSHANDFKWFQFNLVKSIDNKIPFGHQQDTYFEMEFGGRSGVLDFYGFVDFLDVLDSPGSDYHNGDNFFLKLAPRFSLNSLSGQDLSLGAFKEWYVSTLLLVADRSLNEHYLGLGSDVEVPWFGKVGVNLYARYVKEGYGDANEHTWDGYDFSLNWYKPFYFFGNGSSAVYQGYFDYKFGASALADDKDHVDKSIEYFNGLYWHSARYAAGYGLKYYQDMALLKNGGIAGETSGLGHYLSLTYKF